MQRGFDTLQTPVGVALVAASILFLIGVSIWGGFFFKRLVTKDETARKNHRENKKD
jgi:hypothetical protein